MPLLGIDVRGLNVALCVVVVVSRLGIDAAHRADHLACEQDVVDGDHAREQIDAGLLIDARVEEDVVQQMVLQQRLFHLLRQAAEAAPMVGNCAASVRNDEAQRRKILEQVGREALHESSGVGVQVVRPRRVEARIAARAHVDHRRDVVLDHLLVDRVPVAVG